ncbi:hypothetical protein BLA60_25790 [Actinophytocola xinjiangensis]|uniref:AAA domain-containing protein n=1 Tax=Actinophytocola xinjiangensis TaxID=485602 RepID=A0A7Z0WI60_9PSEU|nr:AAA family ATPase [Actinophytocola xinjiangensis]OLF07745.1 hypothetical protein BLA60_25790 [Actinophytocola xinjiangensis]
MPKVQSDLFEQISAYVNAKGSGNQRNGQCPAHDDNTPSLSLTLKGDGSVLFKCQSGCTQEEVLSALREAGLEVPRPGGRRESERSTTAARDTELGRITEVYAYTNEHGEVLFTKARYEPKTFRCGVGDTPKKFKVASIPKHVTPVPYRLPQLLAAIKDGRRVWVVGGEKDVHALEAVGEAATCNHDGEQNWNLHDFTRWFEGATDVRVVKDNDKGGEQYAYDVQASLTEVVGHAGGAVTVWRANLPQKGADVADHLQTGYTLDQLVSVPTVADLAFDDEVRREVHKDRVRREAKRRTALAALSPSARPVSLDDLEQLPTADYLIKVMVPKNTIGEVFGASGSYKSFVMLDAALHVATGRPRWHGHRVRQGRVLYVASEGGLGIHKRIRAWSQHHDLTIPNKNLMVLPYPFQIVAVDALLDRLTEAEFEPDWVIFDTRATSTVGMDENSPTEMGLVTDAMRRLAVELGAAVTTVHHTGWSESDRSRGASSVPAAMDTVWRIEGEKNGRKHARIRCTKVKEDQAPPEFKVELRSVTLPETDEDGDSVTSLVVVDGEVLTRDEKSGVSALEELGPDAVALVARLDAAGIDPRAGLPTIHAWMKGNGVKMSKTFLGQVVAVRKARS